MVMTIRGCCSIRCSCNPLPYSVSCLHQGFIRKNGMARKPQKDESDERQAGRKLYVERETGHKYLAEHAVDNIPSHNHQHGKQAETCLTPAVVIVEDGEEMDGTGYQKNGKQSPHIEVLSAVRITYPKVHQLVLRPHSLRFKAADRQTETGNGHKEGKKQKDGLLPLYHNQSSSSFRASLEGSRQ